VTWLRDLAMNDKTKQCSESMYICCLPWSTIIPAGFVTQAWSIVGNMVVNHLLFADMSLFKVSVVFNTWIFVVIMLLIVKLF